MAAPDTGWAEGRIALVTGATSGFGEAIARRLHGAGARVVACGRRAQRLEPLTALGERVFAAPLDVQGRDAVQAFVDGLPAAFADVDILVNNAGLAAGMGKAHEANLDDWDRMVDTNVKGLMYVTRAILPGMVARGRGHVINMGSVAARYPYPGGNAYGGTKAFVRQFSLNLRADLVGTPVRVTDIEPGMAETEFSLVRFAGDEAAAAKVYEGLDALTPEDIADVVEMTLKMKPHVNLNTVELMPVAQAFAAFAVARR